MDRNTKAVYRYRAMTAHLHLVIEPGRWLNWCWEYGLPPAARAELQRMDDARNGKMAKIVAGGIGDLKMLQHF
jgi:hypothetical protein